MENAKQHVLEVGEEQLRVWSNKWLALLSDKPPSVFYKKNERAKALTYLITAEVYDEIARNMLKPEAERSRGLMRLAANVIPVSRLIGYSAITERSLGMSVVKSVRAGAWDSLYRTKRNTFRTRFLEVAWNVVEWGAPFILIEATDKDHMALKEMAMGDYQKVLETVRRKLRGVSQMDDPMVEDFEAYVRNI